ncbi:HNH endonuclease [Bacillus phage vB_BmeM-Goe8]|uniref:Putative HNH endonuclease n=1 Tax=Bacillus phage vB_BmeM-Goe8 TaxID=2593638 RepID=A0A516KMY6_9CAUD|nr:HNH endonuclease [Bacillus phage vB_BmeM-Goe8]QDP42961.1 putative HNH endonuclease [Bacillus phage vB_BmeM-Goe8]
MRESWKPLKDIIAHGDNYEVSSHGRVRNAKTGRVLKNLIDSNGYHRLSLNLDGKRKTYEVHRLVALAFIPNPESKPMVNHIKGDQKGNNRVDNLEWATGKENSQHAVDTGLSGKTKLNEAIVKEIKQLLVNKVPQNVIAAKFRVTRQCVSSIQRGKTWSHVTIDNFTPYENTAPSRNGKVTEEKVIEIKKLGASGKFSHREIGEMYGLTRRAVSYILSGKTWSHVG